MTKRILFWALSLGILTSVAIGVAEAYLPPTRAKGTIIDALAFPGAAMASVYYTEGLHTGRGAPTWGLAVIVLNFLVYVLFWLVVLLVARFTRHRRRYDSGGVPVRRSGT